MKTLQVWFCCFLLFMLGACGVPETNQVAPTATPTLPDLPGHPGTDPSNPWPYGTPNIAERTQIAVGTIEAVRRAAELATAAAVPTIGINQQPTLTFIPDSPYVPLRGAQSDTESCNSLIDQLHPTDKIATGCWFGIEGDREVIFYTGTMSGEFNFGQRINGIWKVTGSSGLRQDQLPNLRKWQPGTYTNDYGSATMSRITWAPVTDNFLVITQVTGNIVTLTASDNPSRVYVFDFGTNTWTTTPQSAPTLPGTPTVLIPTATPTPAPAAFPANGILDNFNRANGAVGASWTGATSVFAIQSNALGTTLTSGSTNRIHMW